MPANYPTAAPNLNTTRAVGDPDPAGDSNAQALEIIAIAADLLNAKGASATLAAAFALLGVDASASVKGIVKLSVAPAVASNPIGVGDNDPRLALGAPNTQIGAAYTFVLADGTKVVEGNSATAQTFTIPANATVAFVVGTEIVVRQYGAGQITIAAGSVVLRSRGGAYRLAGQYAEATLTKRATDEWVLSGDTIV